MPLSLFLVLDALIQNASMPIIFVAFMVKNAFGSIVFNIFFDKTCRPFPLRREPRYGREDASVVLAVIDPPDTFSKTLSDWVRLGPLEIILVTTPRWKSAVEEHVRGATQQYSSSSFLVKILVCDIPSHRAQQVMGCKAAKGRIILLSDDDIFWHHPLAIEYMLAPFGSKEDGDPCDGPESVGAVFGLQLPVIPAVADYPTEMTPWRAISIKGLEDDIERLKTRFAADGGLLCLVGRTLAIRADLLQNEEFYHYFLNEPWIGTKNLHSGNDCTLTRWIQARAKTVMQCAPEAMLTTLTKSDYKSWLGQVHRWWRNTYMNFIKMLWADRPSLWTRITTQPYTTHQIVDRLLGGYLRLLFIVSWAVTISNSLAAVRQGLGTGGKSSYQYMYDVLLGMVAVYQAVRHVRGVALFSIRLGQRFRLGYLDIMKMLFWRLVGIPLYLDIWAWLTVWVDKWGSRVMTQETSPDRTKTD